MAVQDMKPTVPGKTAIPVLTTCGDCDRQVGRFYSVVREGREVKLCGTCWARPRARELPLKWKWGDS